MRSHALLLAVLGLTVYGQLVIKARSLMHRGPAGEAIDYGRYLYDMYTDIAVISGLGAAVLAAIFWVLTIERLEMGYAYPFMALSFILVPVGSRMLFDECFRGCSWRASRLCS